MPTLKQRGGDRSKRINLCIFCQQGIPAGQHAQTLRFTYLCHNCHNEGYRLKLMDTETGKTVRLLKDGNPVPSRF